MTASLSSLDTPRLKTLFSKYEKEFLEDYLTFLRFPSISTDPQNKSDIQACAEWLIQELKKLGFSVDVWPTSTHPVLFASHLKAGPDSPTLLIYHHYDVQPVDPLDLWTSPPFEPRIENGTIYARGAQDNKGQCAYTLSALKALLREYGSLPLNIKLCIEGEEECGSKGMSEILVSKKKALKADYLAIIDSGIPDPDVPAVTVGVRGIVTFDLTLEGSFTDLHSGSLGGIVMNPLHVLVELFAKMRDSKTGAITIPGFYDDVEPLPQKEREALAAAFDEKAFSKKFGAKATGGEKGFSPLERAGARPTLEINGITGGYGGPGFKTVIPAKASAKFSCRLVPHQSPENIIRNVTQFIKEHLPEGIKGEVHAHGEGGKPVRISPSSSVVKAFAIAYEEVFNKPCQYALMGGSIPVSTALAEASQADMVFVGLGLDSDQIHAPNEHFDWKRFRQGFLIVARALILLGKK